MSSMKMSFTWRNLLFTQYY